jgi:hypothetical protein
MNRSVERAPSITSGPYECSGNGVTVFGHHRETPSVIATELGIHVHGRRTTANGGVSRRRNNPAKPATWWQAQILLYGLQCPANAYGDIVAMKRVLFDAINDDNLRVPVELAQLEARENERYRLVNEEFQRQAEEERVAVYNALPSDAAKAKHDTGRFVRELAVQGGVKFLAGLDVHERLDIHRAAERLRLCTQSIGDDRHRVLVIGRDRTEVWHEVNRLRRPPQQHPIFRPPAGLHGVQRPPATNNGRVYDEEEDEEDEDDEDGEDEDDEDEDDWDDEDNGVDIEGRWILEIPSLRNGYGQQDPFWWEINAPTHPETAWGSFDLGILEGITKINFEGQWIGRQLSFTWRGTETGEGVIQYLTYRGGVTFTGQNTCYGFWNSDYGNWNFTGSKMDENVADSAVQCRRRFDSLTEDAYELARISRWRNRY